MDRKNLPGLIASFRRRDLEGFFFSVHYFCASEGGSGFADNERKIFVPRQVVTPFFRARVEQFYAFMRFWIDGLGLRMLVRIAAKTCPSQILQCRCSASGSRQNVVKCKTLSGKCRGRTAVLTNLVRARRNNATERGGRMVRRMLSGLCPAAPGRILE